MNARNETILGGDQGGDNFCEINDVVTERDIVTPHPPPWTMPYNTVWLHIPAVNVNDKPVTHIPVSDARRCPILTKMSTQSASAAISEVLRQPDDLLKLAAYRKKLMKEKAALDAKLASGVKAQLDATRDALLKLQASRAAVGMIREEMMAVEKLRGEDGEGEAFDRITRVGAI
jgi:hypothetical protein